MREVVHCLEGCEKRVPILVGQSHGHALRVKSRLLHGQLHCWYHSVFEQVCVDLPEALSLDTMQDGRVYHGLRELDVFVERFLKSLLRYEIQLFFQAFHGLDSFNLVFLLRQRFKPYSIRVELRRDQHLSLLRILKAEVLIVIKELLPLINSLQLRLSHLLKAVHLQSEVCINSFQILILCEQGSHRVFELADVGHGLRLSVESGDVFEYQTVNGRVVLLIVEYP